MAAHSPRPTGRPSKGGGKDASPSRRASASGASATGSGQRPSHRGPFFSRGLQRALIGAFLLAPLLALGIQFARAPDEVPAVVSVVKPRVLGPLIAGSLASPQATMLELSLDEINAHLAQVLQPSVKKDSGLMFQSANLRLEPERCHWRTVYRWRGFDLHLRVTYSVLLQGGKLQVRSFSSMLGRVPLGMFWTRKLEDEVLRKLLPALRKEQVLLNRLETLRLENGRALLKVRASAPAPAG